MGDALRGAVVVDAARKRLKALLSESRLDLQDDEDLQKLKAVSEELYQEVKRKRLHKFQWNNRPCYGTELHLACLSRDAAPGEAQAEPDIRARDIVASEPGRVNEVFYWTTENPNGEDQLCTGKAIHLAASRGDRSLVEILLNAGADLKSFTTRGDVDNYDVLHAAVYREGRGGASDAMGRELLHYLFTQGPDLFSVNANGLSCMHVAFQTGDLPTIRALEREVKECRRRSLGQANGEVMRRKAHELLAESDLEKVNFNDLSRAYKDRTPLEIGILWRKMSKEELAKAAPKGMGSLRVFIHCAPECIPFFMNELRSARENAESVEEMKGKITAKDVARMLHDFPEAAACVLACVTARPMEQSPGWHPLPSRVDFASRNVLVRAMGPLIQPPRFRCLYKPEKQWSYNDARYKAPEWHQELVKTKGYYDGSAHSKVQDTKIQVCSIPNIITPSFFSAVLNACSRLKPHEPALFLFKCTSIRAAVSYTFWNGAIWMDVTQFLLSLWGLILLLIETVMAHEGVHDTETLRMHMARVYEPSFITGKSSDFTGVVADWMIAKGIVDFCLEIFQFCGCLVIREPWTYVTRGNFWDILRSVMPILLLWYYQSRWLQACIVFIYWMRLLEGVTYSERVGHALLPLHMLVRGLLPALTFTLIGFCTLIHSMYIVQTKPDPHFSKHFFDTFNILIAQGLENEKPDLLEAALLYGGVLVFSIFVLNIFIGVISEQYSTAKQQVHLMFQSWRAGSCLTYLLRMCVVPCTWMSKRQVAVLAGFCVLLTLGLQTAALGFHRQLQGWLQLLVFILCQLVIFLASIQCKGSQYPWEDFIPKRKEQRYLWIMEPADRESEERQEEMLTEFNVLARRDGQDMPTSREGLVEVIRDAMAAVQERSESASTGPPSEMEEHTASERCAAEPRVEQQVTALPGYSSLLNLFYRRPNAPSKSPSLPL